MKIKAKAKDCSLIVKVKASAGEMIDAKLLDARYEGVLRKPVPEGVG